MKKITENNNLLENIDKEIKNIREFLYEKYVLLANSGEFYGKSSELATSVSIDFIVNNSKHGFQDNNRLNFYYEDFYEIDNKDDLNNEIPIIDLYELGKNNVSFLLYDNNEMKDFFFKEEQVNDILKILGFKDKDIKEIKNNEKERLITEFRMYKEMNGKDDKLTDEELIEVENRFKETYYRFFIMEKITKEIYNLELNSLKELNLDFISNKIEEKRNLINEILKYFKSQNLPFNLMLELNSIKGKDIEGFKIDVYSYCFGPNRNHTYYYGPYINHNKYMNENNKFKDLDEFGLFKKALEKAKNDIYNNWDYEIDSE